MFSFYTEDELSSFLIEKDDLPEGFDEETFYIYQEVKGKVYRIIIPPATPFYYIYFALLKNSVIKRNERIYFSVLSLRRGTRVLKFSQIDEMSDGQKRVFFPLFDGEFSKLLYFNKRKVLPPALEKWVPIYQKENDWEKGILVPKGYFREDFGSRDFLEEVRVKKGENLDLEESLKKIPRVYQEIIDPSDLLSGNFSPISSRVKNLSKEWIEIYEILHFLKKNYSRFPLSGEFKTFHIDGGDSIDSLNHFLKAFYPGLSWTWDSTEKLLRNEHSDFRGDSPIFETLTLDAISEISKNKYDTIFLSKEGLCKENVLFSVKALLPGGNLILKTKVPADDERESLFLLQVLSCSFERVLLFKPESSSPLNSDIFVVGIHHTGKNPYEKHLSREKVDFKTLGVPTFLFQWFEKFYVKTLEERKRILQKVLKDYSRDRNLSTVDILESRSPEIKKFVNGWLEKNPVPKISRFHYGWN